MQRTHNIEGSRNGPRVFRNNQGILIRNGSVLRDLTFELNSVIRNGAYISMSEGGGRANGMRGSSKGVKQKPG